MSDNREKIFYIPNDDEEDDPSTLAYYDDSLFFDDYETYWDVDEDEEDEWIYCDGNEINESFEIVNPETLINEQPNTTNNTESVNFPEQSEKSNDEQCYPVHHNNLSDDNNINQEEIDETEDDEYFPVHHTNLADNNDEELQESDDDYDNQNYHYLNMRRHSI